jgi:hypothetical protein
MAQNIAWWCLILSIASFVLFAIGVLAGFFSRRTAIGAGGLAGARQEGAEEGWAKLAEALAKLVDSLNKSGPTTLTILASFGFMIMALIAAKS